MVSFSLRDYVLPFELISVLFFVAMVGAVMLGKREAGRGIFRVSTIV
jgi:NADH-quinone oxidoreductase subunit J